MQSHIRREYENLERRTRERENEEAHQADLERDLQAARDRAYAARAGASFRAGENEEVFEAREAAAIAAEYRVTDRVNREICEIFAAAGIASERFFRTTEEKRAA